MGKLTEAQRHARTWATEVGYARAICGPLGCIVAMSNHAHEIATVKGDGISILIYPHKTSGTGNISARVRDNGSRDKAKARAIMLAMKSGEGLPEDVRWKVSSFNTFYAKNLPGRTALKQEGE